MEPDDLRYTKEHEWVRAEGELVRLGITDYAQQALGDIVFVNLPDVGAPLRADDPFGEVESTKSVSDLFAPVDGEVIEVNPALEDTPELVNSDPYGEGWMLILRPAEPADLDGLLDAAGYRAYLAEA